MGAKLGFYVKRIKEGRLKEMWAQTKWIYSYAKRYWLHMIFYTALGMTNTVFSLILSFVSRDLVDIITGYQTGEVIKYFVMMIVYGIASTILNMVSNYFGSMISMKVDAEIKAEIFEKIMVTDWESLTSYHSGDLMVRWSGDASRISNGVLNFIPDAVIYIFRFISALYVVIVQDWTFAVFAFLSIPVTVLLSRTLINRMVTNNERVMNLSAKLTGFNQETFLNIQFIKSFDLIKLYIARLKQLQNESIRMNLDFKKMSMWTSLLMSTVGLLVSYSAYGWGIYKVWAGLISYGSMTMFLGLSGTLTGTVQNLTSLVPSAIQLTTSAGRLMKILELPREDYSNAEEADAFGEKHRKDGVSLFIDDVSYGYKNGTDVFSGASFEVRPHEIVAIVGPSGSGKTTMMRLILSLIRTGGGSAYLTGGDKDGSSAGDDRIELSPASRRLFSYVPQGNTMFSGTIAENMRAVKQDATDEEIIDALKKADAWEFVEKLPDTISHEILENGGGFSEGQAQRLSIARALLRKSPLLLLDEATSALDMETERTVLKNITKDEYPRTCVVTTHRPSVLKSCARVYRIRDEKLELMTPDEVEHLERMD